MPTEVAASITKSPNTIRDVTETLELSGNPLKVELVIGDDITEITFKGDEMPPNWLPIEMSYAPVSVDMARYIFEHNNQPLLNFIVFFNFSIEMNKKIADDPKSKVKIFCICSGNEVLIGSDPSSFTRYIVWSNGIHKESSKALQIENMLMGHQKDCRFVKSEVYNFIFFFLHIIINI